MEPRQLLFFLYLIFGGFWNFVGGIGVEGAKRSTAQHCAIYDPGVSTAPQAWTRDTESLYVAKYPVIWNFSSMLDRGRKRSWFISGVEVHSGTQKYTMHGLSGCRCSRMLAVVARWGFSRDTQAYGGEAVDNGWIMISSYQPFLVCYLPASYPQYNDVSATRSVRPKKYSPCD